jgi:hypothetical protein
LISLTHPSFEIVAYLEELLGVVEVAVRIELPLGGAIGFED